MVLISPLLGSETLLPLGGRINSCLRAGRKEVVSLGWTTTYKSPDISIFGFFKEEFNYKRDDGSYGKVIDCSVVNSVAYLAWESFSPEEGMKVTAIACLLDYVPNEVEFAYKDMGEIEGPYCAECPERILKQLTPTENECAIKWRTQCWQNIARYKLSKGKRVQSQQALEFTNGEFYQEFIVEDAKKRLFRTLNGKLVKIHKGVRLFDPTVPQNQVFQGSMF